jgi:hypothetical protein
LTSSSCTFYDGVGIQFWQTTPEWKTFAEEGAKNDAAEGRCETFADLLGIDILRYLVASIILDAS